MSDRPLVSCVMPTRDRRSFVGQSIWYFLRQDYPHRELIVLDDGDDPVGDLLPEDERVRYVRLDEHASLGRKRNLGCELARGELVAHWDDDDWIRQDRLRVQVEALTAAGADFCGADRLLHYRLDAGDAWLYHYRPNGRPRLAGATLVYRREAWARTRFADVELGEDAEFLGRVQSEAVHVLPDSSFYVAVVHRRNASAWNLRDIGWEPHAFDEVAARLGNDRAFYVDLRNGESGSVPARATSTAVTLVAFFMAWDGYGAMSECLALGMSRAGATVNAVPLGIDEEGLTHEFKALVAASRPDPGSPVLWFAQPEGALESHPVASDVFVNTMWESDRLPSGWLGPLDRVRGVIVPTRFVADVCRRQGVQTPIDVIPEGVDPELYHYVERPPRAGLTTLMVGPVVRRKHVQEGAEAWLRAFERDPDARLLIKSKFDLHEGVPEDPRIRVVSDTERSRGIPHWYRQADVLLALGNEGFGLPLVEAMATGIPVIALDSEGQSDVCADAEGLVLSVPPDRWEACDDTPWGLAGKRAVPSVQAVADRLRWIDRHRDEARELGRAGSEWALQNRNIWDKGLAVLDAMERRMARPRPLRRIRTLWAAGGTPDTHTCTGALADELPGVRLTQTPPLIPTLRLLHAHHDEAAPADLDLTAYMLEAKLAGVPVVVSEHAVGMQAQAWERDAAVLVVASEAAADRLRRRWPAKAVEILPYGCPRPVAAVNRRRGRVLATLGSLEDDTPWRMLEVLESIRGSSLLVLAPRAARELEEAWREATHDLPVKRVALSLDSQAAAGVLARRADAVVFWENSEPGFLGSSTQVRVALASGVPIVTSATSRYADVAAPTFQPSELEEGIEALLDDERLRLSLQEQAEAYCDEHSWAAVARRHLALWESVEST
jgi:glycosyltransferase involved in cell wall biosynthesis